MASHLAAEGLGLMAFVADPDDQLPLLEFGVEKFFSYNRRLDNCANCKEGDTSGEMVRDLASAYISKGRSYDAIQLIQRFVTDREAEVSAACRSCRRPCRAAVADTDLVDHRLRVRSRAAVRARQASG
jgi:hypothetical protein